MSYLVARIICPEHASEKQQHLALCLVKLLTLLKLTVHTST